jgi:hypothetical protein
MGGLIVMKELCEFIEILSAYAWCVAVEHPEWGGVTP